MTSGGIPIEAVRFFADLEANNTKSWWVDNKTTYETVVRGPFLQLLDDLGDDDQSWRVYRPHRDTRFAKDKSPYKTFIGAVTQQPGGNGHFIQISKNGLLVGSGYPMMAKDQLQRFREAIDNDRHGQHFVQLVDEHRADGHTVTTGRYDPLKTAPKGYPRDHPRIEWLQAKGVELPERAGTPNWLSTATAAQHVRTLLTRGQSLTAWLDNHVGPSELSPEEIWGRKKADR